ncbi:DUF6197 family protein [Streptomyces daliensis]
MTTYPTTTATRPLADVGQVDIDAAVLVVEIEHYLEARARGAAAPAPTTAHPLVSRTTQQLVDEALSTTPAVAAAPELRAPWRLLRLLPDTVLRRLPRRTRAVSVAEHLELVALTLVSYGWTGHGALRTRSGRRCIAGAQTVLHHLGYGDARTVAEAGRVLDEVLAERGQAGPYWQWNDAPGRREEEALGLVRAAAARAGRSRR